MILEFFKKVQAQESKMKGFIVMDSLEDPSESIVLTFWETKEEMDNFYQVDNHLLSIWLKNLNPFLKHYLKEEVMRYLIFKFSC